MAETLTSIQIRPTTRNELRRVKAQVAETAQRPVDYDDMVQALMRCWESAGASEQAAMRYLKAASGEAR